jgi:glucans biosynthesis protein
MMLMTVLTVGAAGACASESQRPSDGEETSTVASSQPDLDPWQASTDGPSLFEHVTEQARTLAASPYRAPDVRVTGPMSDLTYGQYRGIRFRSESAIWRDEAPFQLQLFHPGAGNDTPVRIHVVENGVSRRLEYDPSLFTFGDELAGIETALPPDADFAGLRVLYPMNDPDHFDEVISFLGASYFRIVGPGQVYGLSTRGIAVDTGDPDGEEFPDFTALWVVRPEPGDSAVTLFGLMDGPSLSGAYRFESWPGERTTEEHEATAAGTDRGGRGTVVEVEARLFARNDVGKLGVAPLTSMYLHGTLRSGGDDDFRPRVHDSEGLLMHTGADEWIWRPLTNRSGVRFTSLLDIDPLGYGLVQRDRDFGSFMDLEAQYHRRPSEWVAIEGGWGRGAVELVEIPTNSEFNDNIVAYWRPDEPFRAGEERRYRYRLVTFDDRLDSGPRPGGPVDGQTLGQVARTRIGWDALPGEADPPPRSQRRVVVDFTGGGLATLPDSVQVEAIVQAFSGLASDVRVERLPDGGRRATFSLLPDEGRGADMRLYLQVADTAVTETWSYLWESPSDR